LGVSTATHRSSNTRARGFAVDCEWRRSGWFGSFLDGPQEAIIFTLTLFFFFSISCLLSCIYILILSQCIVAFQGVLRSISSATDLQCFRARHQILSLQAPAGTGPTLSSTWAPVRVPAKFVPTSLPPLQHCTYSYHL